jgi:hypothetical protein
MIWEKLRITARAFSLQILSGEKEKNLRKSFRDRKQQYSDSAGEFRV